MMFFDPLSMLCPFEVYYFRPVILSFLLPFWCYSMSLSTFITVDLMSFWLYFPIRCYVLFGVKYFRPFVFSSLFPIRCFVLSTFCPNRRFFCRIFVSFNVMSIDNLSIEVLYIDVFVYCRRFLLQRFVGESSLFILSSFRLLSSIFLVSSLFLLSSAFFLF